jgi:hypothetical protein
VPIASKCSGTSGFAVYETGTLRGPSRSSGSPRVPEAQTTARDARRMSLLFVLDFQKRSATPTSKNQPERARCCLTFASREGAAWHREASIQIWREQAVRCPGIHLPLRCDCYATVYRDLIVGWTYATQNELAFLSSLRAVKRRAGVCRPIQVTVRIRVSTARDEQDWQDHRR